MIKNKKPLVSIICITYNHAGFIRNAIEGFLIQKTDFLFEIIIHDDASTDGTQAIISDYLIKYPNLFIPILQKENQFSKGKKILAELTFPLARGKYIALCEGDDYWTDPLKLQKQVEFLEANPDYGMVHSELGHYHHKTGKYIERHWEASGVTKQSGDIYESLMIGRESMVYFCTALFRANLKNHGLHDPRVKMGDKPLAIWIALNSKIGYIDEAMAVRNVLLYSATQGRKPQEMLEFYQSAPIIFQYFKAIRPVSQIVEKQFYINYYSNIANHCFRHKIGKEHFKEAFSFLKKNKPTLKIYLQKIGLYKSYMFDIMDFTIKGTASINRVFRNLISSIHF